MSVQKRYALKGMCMFPVPCKAGRMCIRMKCVCVSWDVHYGAFLLLFAHMILHWLTDRQLPLLSCFFLDVFIHVYPWHRSTWHKLLTAHAAEFWVLSEMMSWVKCLAFLDHWISFARTCLYEPCRTMADDFFSPSVLYVLLIRGESLHCSLRFFQFLSFIWAELWRDEFLVVNEAAIY